jgi:hypothetical protein
VPCIIDHFMYHRKPFKRKNQQKWRGGVWGEIVVPRHLASASLTGQRQKGPICEFNQEKELVQCPVGQDLFKYLASRETDRERSQSNPHCMRNDLVWCYWKEQIYQEALHNILGTGLLKERWRGQGSLNGQSGHRN